MCPYPFTKNKQQQLKYNNQPPTMAYARWVEGSYWYVYWSSSSGNTKNTQIVCVDCANEYSYTDVKNFDTVVKIMNSFECGIEAAEQLKDCFDAFIQDVDEKFK